MSQFDRITQHREDKLGQAFIRDTDITVSQVVAPIVSDGRTVDSILSEYDELELEDVHQALAFAVFDLMGFIISSHMEISSFLTPIVGYPDLARHFENLTFDRWSGTIFNLGNQAKFEIDCLLRQANTYFATPMPPKQHFGEIQQDLENSSHSYNKRTQVTFDIPNDLPYIPRNQQLNHAFLILISHDLSHLFTLNSNIHVRQVSSTHIRCQLSQTLSSNHPIQNLSEEIKTLSTMISLSSAYRIIEKFGSELCTEIIDDSVIFSFELPIWTDDE